MVQKDIAATSGIFRKFRSALKDVGHLTYAHNKIICRPVSENKLASLHLLL
jgi:hypothetical protein